LLYAAPGLASCWPALLGRHWLVHCHVPRHGKLSSVLKFRFRFFRSHFFIQICATKKYASRKQN
jgi:hypothetical protein